MSFSQNFIFYFSKAHLARNWWSAVKLFLSLLGTFELVMTLISFCTKDGKGICLSWPVMLAIIGVVAVVAFFATKPKFKVAAKIEDLDARVVVLLGDVFTDSGDYVIACNRMFDTSIEKGVLPKTSVQAQYQQRFFGGDVSTVDKMIDSEIGLSASEDFASALGGKTRKYAVGTIAKISNKDGNAYFVALSEMDACATRQITKQDFRRGLDALWNYFSTRGRPRVIKMPVLCSGTTSLGMSREDIIKQIIFSYVNFVKVNKTCQELRIYVKPEDARTYEVDMYCLEKFLELACAGDLMAVADAGRDADSEPGEAIG